jgi:hypothetical protein
MTGGLSVSWIRVGTAQQAHEDRRSLPSVRGNESTKRKCLIKIYRAFDRSTSVSS